MNIVWSPLALDRVVEHGEFLSHENPAAAERWIVDGFRAAERLAVFPMSGRQVTELKRNDLLEIIVGVFRIIYRIDAKHAAILTLRHTKQLPDAGELPDL